MATKTAETPQQQAKASRKSIASEPAAFITPDGCRYEVADGENLGRATALASEETLKRIWGTSRRIRRGDFSRPHNGSKETSPPGSMSAPT